jgi:hypothetical protein
MIDGQTSWLACTSPWTVPSGVGIGAGATYTFSLKVTDAYSNTITTSKSYTNGSWPNFPGEPANMACGQSITYERNCTQPSPSIFGGNTLTGLTCQGYKFKTYTKNCTNYKTVATAYQTTLQNLRYWNQDCSPLAPQSFDLRDAIMKFCSGNPYWNSGWGPFSIEVLSDINQSPMKQTCFTSDIATVLTVPNSALSGANSACQPSTAANSYECHKAAHLYCRSAGNDAGYGPTQSLSSGKQIVCLKAGAGTIFHTNFTTLQNYHPLCDSSDPISPNCRNAAHYFCKATSNLYETGLGLYNVQSGNADVYCVFKDKQI